MSLSISDLPTECLVKIFSKLTIKELSRIALVSKGWKGTSTVHELWKDIKIYASPTPDPAYDYVMHWIKKTALPTIASMEIILSKEDLPSYYTGFVPSAVSQPENWSRFAQFEHGKRLGCDLKEKIDDSFKMMQFFTFFVYVFKISLVVAKVGLIDIEEVEKMALKTKETFRNPLPFEILEIEYRIQGNESKAEEMKGLRTECLSAKNEVEIEE